jgi:Skp family chaperone for outer membrane proteins
MVIVAGLATLGALAYLGSQLWAQQPAPAQAPACPKVGLVNMAVVLKNYNKFKVYNDEIEKIRIQYDKQHQDLLTRVKQWQEFGVRPQATQAEREQAEDNIKKCKRLLEDNDTEFTKVRQKKSDDQMVQMYKEIEDAIKAFAGPNGFHLILHYSEPLMEADKYTAPNVQRKLVGPGGCGCVCPTYFVPGMDVSADVVRQLNAMYPAPAAPVAAAPGGKQ